MFLINFPFSWEENLYYPMFNPKFDTSFIVAEHEGFHAGTIALEEYLVSTLPAGAKYGFGKTAPAHEQVAYDGAKVQELINAFVETLATHVSFTFGLCFAPLSSHRTCAKLMIADS